MLKSTRSNLIIASTYSGVLILGMFLGYKFLREQGYTITAPGKISRRPQALAERGDILGIINQNYVDSIDASELKGLSIDSMMHRLDPHSRYLPAKEAQELTDKMNGHMEGIGVEYYILNDTLLVTHVVPGGPAQKAGMQRGDKILAINGRAISGKNLPAAEMRGKLKGPAGTSVKIKVLHNAQEEPVTLTATRQSIAVSSISAAYMLRKGVGYIKIDDFDESTGADFAEAARKLKAQGMQKLVLDLRDNAGGLVAGAISVADQFLPKNKLIMYAQGAHLPRMEYVSSGLGEFKGEKLVVLLNESTASSSEILAGALQDLKRAKIVGRRSFGKGLIQENFALPDGSAINLTIGRYYTPTGRSIQKAYDKGNEVYAHELDDRYNSGELSDESKGTGAGGIKPDVFVPIDTMKPAVVVNQLVNEKILTDYVFRHLTSRYSEEYVKKHPGMALTAKDFAHFCEYARIRRPELAEADLQAARQSILTNLQALLLKYYLGDAEYHKTLSTHDPEVQKAVGSL